MLEDGKGNKWRGEQEEENKKRGRREGIGEAKIIGKNRVGDDEGGWRMAFWNIAGMGNKDMDFWRILEQWDAMVLIEAWVEESSWMKVKEKLPKRYEWGIQYARREGKRGRAIGGMIMGVRRELMEKRTRIKGKEEGIIIERVRCGEEKWRMVGVYVNGEEATTVGTMDRGKSRRSKDNSEGGGF